VAIHEAMEQQTISIAKAGITTILNSRTSVLAAANPIWGRYDDQKSPTENIDFQATILSRFDLIFIVRDLHDVKRDRQLALHIIDVHRRGESYKDQKPSGKNLLEVSALKKYITFARTRCKPRLSDEAAAVLRSKYVKFRQHHQEQREKYDDKPPIPITVRQLEAIVRLSEAMARIELSPVANVDHVNEAVRLFQVATMQAAGAKVSGYHIGKEAQRAVQAFKARVPIGSAILRQRLLSELVANGHDELAVVAALDHLRTRGDIVDQAMQRAIKRLR